MDLVYASLDRRAAAAPEPAQEVSELLGALWAHAAPDDGLEHITGRAEDQRVDLLFFLLTTDPAAPGARSAVDRTEALLRRCHQASPSVHRRYLPPRPLAEATRPTR
ncbi:hypothetical protein [Streptacidiphilus neutrinimicus]|uniref:hypothetical protein n=1 Tax=Streptacidiphilus neutrinimicus TaxID=105420 RepID=UPI0005AB10FE|nr:hypothetical protein [Streptacidiphilus neutrinimicus]